MALQLWKYNTTTGYWKIERGVTPETKDEWLRIFEKDDPNGSYVVSASRPTKPGKLGRVKLTDAARRSRLHRALDAAMDAKVNDAAAMPSAICPKCGNYVRGYKGENDSEAKRDFRFTSHDVSGKECSGTNKPFSVPKSH
jgi:hypothetical protein